MGCRECDCTEYERLWGTLGNLSFSFGARGVGTMPPGAIGDFDADQHSSADLLTCHFGLAPVDLRNGHIPMKEFVSQDNGTPRQSHIEFNRGMDMGSISGWRRNSGAAQDDGIWLMVRMMRIVRASPAREGPRKPSMGEGS